MSVPVQVIAAGASLQAAVEEVQARAGNSAGLQTLWVLRDPHTPDFPARCAAQLRQMLAAPGHEGGQVSVLVGDSVASLRQALAGLQATDAREPGLAQRQTRVGLLAIVLAEAEEAGALHALQLPVVHVVPELLDRRRLLPHEREQAAGNLLALLVDLCRTAEARELLPQFAEAYGGVRMTLVQTARFQAPTIQRILSRRLATRTVERLSRALEEGARDPQLQRMAVPPELPDSGAGEALYARADELASRVAEQILGEGRVPDRDTLHLRAQRAAAGLPDRLRAELVAHGNDLRERGLQWQKQLHGWLDDQLTQNRFAAVVPAKKRLQAALDALGQDALEAETELAASLKTADLPVPDPSPVLLAQAALDRARQDQEDSGTLFAAWGLAVAAVVGTASFPAFGALMAPAAGATPTFVQARAGLLGAGALTAVVWLLSGAVYRWQLAREQAQLDALSAALQSARQSLRNEWARRIAEHIEETGLLLQARLRRFAAHALQQEITRLLAIETSLGDLAQRFRQRSGTKVGESSFDSDIALPEAFYDLAEQGADASEIAGQMEEQLAVASWRQQLDVMNPEAVLREAMERFGTFAEHVPFAERQELRQLAVAPSKQALQAMFTQLGGLLTAEYHAERLAVVPKELREAVPDTHAAHTQVLYGLGDVFAALTRPLQAPLAESLPDSAETRKFAAGGR